MSGFNGIAPEPMSTKITALTLTHNTSQTWVDDENFNRLSAYKMANGMYTLYGNLRISQTGELTNFVTIGSIAGWNTTNNSLITVPGQSSNGGVLVIQVTTNGMINIASYTGILQNSFYRFQLTVF